MSTTYADRLCNLVAQTKDMPNATARIAAWLVGAAEQVGGFPVSLSYRQIKDGFARNGVQVQGTGSRVETIKAAIDWLETRGMLQSIEGGASGFGHSARLYTLTL